MLFAQSRETWNSAQEQYQFYLDEAPSKDFVEKIDENITYVFRPGFRDRVIDFEKRERVKDQEVLQDFGGGLNGDRISPSSIDALMENPELAPRLPWATQKELLLQIVPAETSEARLEFLSDDPNVRRYLFLKELGERNNKNQELLQNKLGKLTAPVILER